MKCYSLILLYVKGFTPYNNNVQETVLHDVTDRDH